MGSIMKKTLWNAVIIIACLFVQSCTFIGLGLGSMADRHRPGFSDLSDVKKLPSLEGSSGTITLRDGKEYQGTITKVNQDCTLIYKENYTRALAKYNHADKVPALGDSIKIHLSSGVIWQGNFAGFDLNSIAYHGHDHALRYLDLNSFKSLEDSRNIVLSAEDIKYMGDSGKIPFLSLMTFMSDQQLYTIPIDSVQTLKIPVIKNTGKITLAIIGGVIDLGFILYVAAFSKGFGG